MRKYCSSSSSRWLLLSVILMGIVAPGAAQYGDCSTKDYDRCVRMANPLLTDPHLIFPDNMDDIDHVCRTWSTFVDCIKSYIDRCFTETRRHQFNKAVESPVDSVHQMCTPSSYQIEYLQHATCLKSTLTDDLHCGRHYKQLVAQVQGPRDMGRADLCCSHQRFRDCVLTETKRVCDVKLTVSSKMLASAFSRQILDKALSFLREQCSNYKPAPGDCPGYQPSTNRQDLLISSEERDFMQQPHTTRNVPTQTIETRYLTNDQVFSDNFQPTVEDRGTVNPQSWLPDHSRDGRHRTTKMEDLPTARQPEDPFTRSSYGRGMTWDMPTTQPAPKDRDDDREDIFRATHYKPSTESWYPGNNINFQGPDKGISEFPSNDVDEPNQQGLAHLDNFDDGAAGVVVPSAGLLLVLLMSYFALA